MLPARHILLVEDDDEDQMIFRETLAEIYYTGLLSVAGDGVEALQQLEQLDVLPDLIFLDINMPRLNGLEFLAAIKKKPDWSCIPVFILSTSPSQVTISIARKLGANGYLTKPFSRILLTEKLQQVLDLAFSPSEEKGSKGFLQLITH